MYESYSTNKLALIIRETTLEINYLGTSYKTEYDANIVECLARLLNNIQYNASVVHKELVNILNIMEPPQQKTIEFDGFRYIAK